MLIGDKIRELRNKKDMSQQELAKAIGVSDQAISQWENGKKQPRMGSVEKLANYFNVPKSYLIEDSIGMDKVLAGTTALASAAVGMAVGGPIYASIMGTIAAVGSMVNTINSHADKKTKDEMPFLVTKDEDEKSLLYMYRALPEESKNTVKVLIETLLKQSEIPY